MLLDIFGDSVLERSSPKKIMRSRHSLLDGADESLGEGVEIDTAREQRDVLARLDKLLLGK